MAMTLQSACELEMCHIGVVNTCRLDLCVMQSCTIHFLYH